MGWLHNTTGLVQDYGRPVDIVHWTDAHAQVGEDQERHRALGWFIGEYKRRTPRRVICVCGGDQGDLPSFNPAAGSPLRNNKDGFRSSRKFDVLGEIVATKESLELTLRDIDAADLEFAERGENDRVGETYLTAGNHEHNVLMTALELSPIATLLKREDLDIKTFCLVNGIKWIDFQKPLILNGIWFQHIWKYKGQRLTVQTMFNRWPYSTVTGDSHEQKLINGRGPDGKPRFSYSNGSWCDKSFGNPWEIDRGLTIFKNVYSGACDIEWVRQDTVLNLYRKHLAKEDAARFSVRL